MGENHLIATVILAASLIIVGAVMWGTTWAAVRGTLTRNAVAGYRAEATRASDAAWVAGHRMAMPAAQAIAVIGLAGPVLMLLLGILWGLGAAIATGAVALLLQCGLAIAPLPHINRAARRAG